MAALVWSLSLTAAAFWLHVLLWRIRIPRRQTRALLLLFLGCLAVGLAGLKVGASVSPRAAWFPSAPAAFAQIALFHVAMTLAYVITYSGIEADSPSLEIVLRVAEAGAQGLSRDRILAELNDDLLVRPRIGDLVRDALIVRDGTRYKITPKGRAFVGLFISYRRLLGAGKGG